MTDTKMHTLRPLGVAALIASCLVIPHVATGQQRPVVGAQAPEQTPSALTPSLPTFSMLPGQPGQPGQGGQGGQQSSTQPMVQNNGGSGGFQGGQGQNQGRASLPIPPVVPDPVQSGYTPPAPTTDERAVRRLIDEVQGELRGYMAPGDHTKILNYSEETARARARKTPIFENKMKIVPLDPNAEIPVVKMDLGQMTAIAFVDSTGEPWPIMSCSWSAGFTGDKPGEGTHLLMLRASTQFEHGSLVCQLKGLTTPARMRLESGQGTHYIGVDAQIPKLGPNAKPAPYDVGGGPLVAGDEVLSNFLYGAPPKGANKLDVVGGGTITTAWEFNGAIFLRTPMVLLSPGPKAEARREGVHIYKVAVVPVMVLDNDGHEVQIKIHGAKVVRANVQPDGEGSPIRQRPTLSVH